MIPPPTPKSALKKPATRPMRTSRRPILGPCRRSLDRPRRGPRARRDPPRRRRHARADRRRGPKTRASRRGARRARAARGALRARRLCQRPHRRGCAAARRSRRHPLRRVARPRADPEAPDWSERILSSQPVSTGPWRTRASRSRSTTGRRTTKMRRSTTSRRSPSGRAREGLVPRFGRKVLEIRPPVRGGQRDCDPTPARGGELTAPSTQATTRPISTVPRACRPRDRRSHRRLLGRGAGGARQRRGHRRRTRRPSSSNCSRASD